MCGTDDAFLADIAARWKREDILDAERTAQRLAQAREEARRLARAFAEADPGLRKVYFFGSAADGSRFRMDSDIDLAVEGGNLLALVRIALCSDFKVDVIDLADAREGVRARIVSEGIILHDKKD